MNNLKLKDLTAEEFIREKIRAKLELKGEMNGLWTYGLNGEDALRWAQEYAEMKANGAYKSTNPALHKHIVMPRISYFIDENGNNVDLNAEGVNAKLKKDGTFEYYRSFGFAGRKELTPVYGA